MSRSADLSLATPTEAEQTHELTPKKKQHPTMTGPYSDKHGEGKTNQPQHVCVQATWTPDTNISSANIEPNFI